MKIDKLCGDNAMRRKEKRHQRTVEKETQEDRIRRVVRFRKAHRSFDTSWNTASFS